MSDAMRRIVIFVVTGALLLSGCAKSPQQVYLEQCLDTFKTLVETQSKRLGWSIEEALERSQQYREECEEDAVQFEEQMKQG